MGQMGEEETSKDKGQAIGGSFWTLSDVSE